MTATRDILNAGLAVQSANLAFSNIKKKKKKSSGLFQQGVDNIFGTSMIKAQANIIGGID